MCHIIGGDCVSVRTSLRWLVIVFCFSLDVADWIFKNMLLTHLDVLKSVLADFLWCRRRCIGYFWTLSVFVEGLSGKLEALKQEETTLQHSLLLQDDKKTKLDSKKRFWHQALTTLNHYPDMTRPYLHSDVQQNKELIRQKQQQKNPNKFQLVCDQHVWLRQSSFWFMLCVHAFLPLFFTF